MQQLSNFSIEQQNVFAIAAEMLRCVACVLLPSQRWKVMSQNPSDAVPAHFFFFLSDEK